jgi:hypothetical protein
VELGAQLADAHLSLAITLNRLYKDTRSAYQHAMCARTFAAKAGQESQQALACYQAAMYLLEVRGLRGIPSCSSTNLKPFRRHCCTFNCAYMPVDCVALVCLRASIQ